MRIKVDECPAGPAMDAAVVKAAGWLKNYIYDNDGFPKRTAYVDPQANYKEIVADITTWHPSIDIAAAWVGIEFMQASSSESWERFCTELCENYNLLRGKANGDAPLRVCRAFLRANGVEFIEVPE